MISVKNVFAQHAGILLAAMAVSLQSPTLSASAGTIFVTDPVTILETDFSYDNNNIVVKGPLGNLTINGSHTFTSLTLMDGAVVTHSPGITNGMQLSIPEQQDYVGIIATSDTIVETAIANIPGGSLIQGSYESSDEIRIISEKIGLPLFTPVDVDITGSGYFDEAASLPGGTLSIGSLVDMYLLHFDSVADSSVNLSGSVTFDTDVVGVILSADGLNGTDYLGSEQLVYPTGSHGRGMELGPYANITISSDLRTVTITTLCEEWMDQVRIFTHSPIDDVRIDAESAIVLNGCGHAATSGPGAGEYGGGNTPAGGAGYGGNGANSDRRSGGAPYGSFSAPVELGSGGGSATGATGGRGGGAVQLMVGGQVHLDGTIEADGSNGTNDTNYSGSAGGGGSGGSVYIVTDRLAGSGEISVCGGLGGAGWSTVAGGGGGGRVSIECDHYNFLGELKATGYPGTTTRPQGGAGTIYQMDRVQGTASLTIENGGIEGATTDVVEPMSLVGDLVIGAGGKLSAASLELLSVSTTGDVTIEPGGSIYLAGRGHEATAGPGAGEFGENNTPAGGGGYGGNGADSSRRSGGVTYGSFGTPLDFGSGGGSASGATGGRGGGAVHLVVGNQLVIDGIIDAGGLNGTNDQNNSGSAGGGGSGGSVYIEAGHVGGNGTVRARGGLGGAGWSTLGGCGGGGRVAMYYDEYSFIGTVETIGAPYEYSRPYGGAGTVFLANELLGEFQLIIDNGTFAGATTDLVETLSIDGTLIVRGEGRLSVPASALFPISVTGDIAVETDGYVVVDGRGHEAGAGPGAGDYSGSYNSGGGGGGYGGRGGDGEDGDPGGEPYGSDTDPFDLGSGGGSCGSAQGGKGGGVLWMVAGGDLLIDGSISARGTGGGNNSTYNQDGGGGSGGSIYVRAAGLHGAGSISAVGGNAGGNGGGGGGGGRVAIYCCNVTLPGTNITTVGGSGHEIGSEGSIYVDCSLSPVDEISEIRLQEELLNAFPNPFNPQTTLRFYLAKDCSVELRIHDLQGRVVRDLLIDERLSSGRHTINWSGCDNVGRSLASGIYLVRLQAGKQSVTERVTLLK